MPEISGWTLAETVRAKVLGMHVLYMPLGLARKVRSVLYGTS